MMNATNERRGRWWPGATAVVPVAVLIASCSNGGGGATTSADDGSGTTGAWVSPLAELMGWGADREGEPDEEQIRRQRQVEEQIADCMRDEGFEYIPRDPETSMPWLFGGFLDDGPWALPRDEFVRQYGFGISTIDHDEDVIATEDDHDPNWAIVEDLSDSARDAYYQALYGSGPGAVWEIPGGGGAVVVEGVEGSAITGDDDPGDEDAGDPDDTDDTRKEGCQQEAYAEVHGDDTTTDEDRESFRALEQEMNSLWERISSDPRTSAALGAYLECMSDAGYPDLERIWDAEELVWDRYSDLAYDEVFEPEDLLLGTDEDDSATIRAAGGASEEIDPAELEELRAFELEIAAADFECKQDYEQVERVVQRELEEEFIAANRDELEQYRDARATSGMFPGVAGEVEIAVPDAEG